MKDDLRPEVNARATDWKPTPGETTVGHILAMTDDEYKEFRSTPEGRQTIQRLMSTA
jgi:hypothetical protein